MTQEEKFERAKRLYETANADQRYVLESLFPELKESKDEKIRKKLIAIFSVGVKVNAKIGDISYRDILAWLEKQGSEPNWCHHKVDLSDCSEEYRKAYYDGWNNCNMQYSQYKSELDDVVKCLINGMKFYYNDNEEATWGTDKWSMPIKHIIEVLERQIEQKYIDKVEPKFHKGDLIKHNKANIICKVISVNSGSYYVENIRTSSRIELFNAEQNFHLWTIEDAKEGDVLYFSDNTIVIFKDLYNATTFHSYCHIEDGVFDISKDYMPDWWEGEGFRPATKEQCDILFAKIKEAGYKWDVEKKELKKD